MNHKKQLLDLSRRTLLKSSLCGIGVTLGGGFASGRPAIPIRAAGISKYEDPTVEIESGKLRGVVANGAYIFRGIPYGATTTGVHRFLPARPPEPWTGIRDAFQNGHSSPQLAPPLSPIGWGLRSNALQDEDCLVLNVFTTGINDQRKRPVMMWLHGGGYTYGSGSSLGYDGANLSRKGDVVVVCVNHRLNILGHLYLGGLSADYEDSGNTGILDIIAALRWVHANAAQFGGDSRNVTIFGQSGGGGKVSTLLGMPGAKGLFHKAIVESGSTLTQISKDDAEKTTERVMMQLGLKTNQIGELQNLPVQKLLAAMGSLRFGPVVDGHSLPRDPFEPTAPDGSADVPMIIGTTETEGTYFAPPELLALDEAAVRARLTERLGSGGDRLFELFKSARPTATPSEIYFTIAAFPANAHVQAERKAAQRKGPAFLYQIRWRTPVNGGRRLSPHCVEIPFAMQNVWQLPELVGTGPELQPLADKVSGAWVAFAHNGSPNHPGIPNWPVYNSAERPTMHINNEWHVTNDPDREERIAINSYASTPFGLSNMGIYGVW